MSTWVPAKARTLVRGDKVDTASAQDEGMTRLKEAHAAALEARVARQHLTKAEVAMACIEFQKIVRKFEESLARGKFDQQLEGLLGELHLAVTIAEKAKVAIDI